MDFKLDQVSFAYPLGHGKGHDGGHGRKADENPSLGHDRDQDSSHDRNCARDRSGDRNGAPPAASPFLFQNLTLTLQAGEALSLLGANGAGKSTLIRCLLGFLPWTAGRSLLDGKDLRDWEDRDFWQQVAYVPQAHDPAFPYTVRELVLMGRNPHLGLFAQPGADDLAQAQAAIQVCGLNDLADQACSQLSGGELQMTMIARALAAEPRLLVMDEPEAGLDFANQLRLLDLVEALSRDQGTAVIMATHDPSLAWRLGGKTLLFAGGGRTVYGPTREVLTEDYLRAAYGVDFALLPYDLEGVPYRALVPLRPVSGQIRANNGKEER